MNRVAPLETRSDANLAESEYTTFTPGEPLMAKQRSVDESGIASQASASNLQSLNQSQLQLFKNCKILKELIF
jgi:hypothetical protein